MKNRDVQNIAFIDGQNLFLGTTRCHICAKALGIDMKDIRLPQCTCGLAFKIDLKKFRIYLRDKYAVSEAYYFFGYLDDRNDELYKEVQRAGFIVLFKEHSKLHASKKKGNIDTDMVFEIMRNVADNPDFQKIVLISNDGDYKKLVKYLLTKDKFEKMLFPNKHFASSLYKELGSERFDYIENIRAHIT
jgi:uncharacterized LabA/DUF88 family protein